MYKLYTDKAENFECDVTLEGASIQNSSARLIIESENINLLFEGKINSDGKCIIPIKRLKGLLPESSTGDIRLEVIAEDMVFVPWKSKYTVSAARKVKVEVKETSTIIKPKVNILESKTVDKNITIHSKNLIALLSKKGLNSYNDLNKNKKLVTEIIQLYSKKKHINKNQISEIIDTILKKLI